MSGDVQLSWPNDRGCLPGPVDRGLGRFARLLCWARSSARSLLRYLSARAAQIVSPIGDRPRPRGGRLAPNRSGRVPTLPAPNGRVRLRGTPGAPRYSTVRVGPEFSPRDYPAIFAALQAPAGSKLLDLVSARLLCADLFEDLAAAWTVGRETVPRLGILVSFERWVMLRDAALAQLQPLAVRGIRVEVHYAEQASAGYLAAWFAHGQVVHDVPAAIATLAAHWHPSPSGPLVIDTLCRLARAHTSAAELPVLVTQLAALALSCGDAVRAATLAREALFYLPEAPSATRCQALRELGTALLCQGQIVAGQTFLDRASTMAAHANVPDVGASALYHSGLCALNHGDYPAAERRFRDAIALLSTGPLRRHLLALAHHSLAVALLHQGHPDAEAQAQIALALRPDPKSHLAEQDRMLLAKLRERRGDTAPPDRAVATDAPTPPRASEADV
jgi:tetratricopeptide (TPR) repeat protein